LQPGQALGREPSSPEPDCVSGTTEFDGDLQIARRISIGCPQHNLGPKGERLRRRMGTSHGFQLFAFFIIQHNRRRIG